MKAKTMNSKLVKKSIIAFFLLMIAIILINITISKYESEANSDVEIDVAFYLLKEDFKTMSVALPEIIPRAEPYVYVFSIGNNDKNSRTETAIEYDLELITTTNLPLRYELYLNKNYNENGAVNIINQNNIEQDEDNTYFRHITTTTRTFGYKQDETNIYYLVVYFPEEYNSIDYQNIIESIQIKINSRQLTND